MMNGINITGILQQILDERAIKMSAPPSGVTQMNNIFKDMYSDKLKSLSDVIEKLPPKKVETKCTCDMYKVLLVSGCQCGGK